MKKSEKEFLMRLANRTIPGAGRVVEAVTGLDKRIDNLEKKVAGLDDTVDEQVSQLERRIDELAKPEEHGRTEPEQPQERGSA
jgi:phosphate uptake regulator